MNRDEYNVLFHKMQLNLVAFKRLMDCGEEVLARVNEAIREALAEQPAQQQEPVAWITRRTADGGVYVDGYETCESTDYGAIPVYTTSPEPASKPWVGLTDEERRSLREWQKIQEELGPVWAPMMLYLYEAIEAKLKQKNT